MPGVWKTPARSVRVSEEVWAAAKAASARKDETVTDVIIRALVDYARRDALKQRLQADAITKATSTTEASAAS